MHRSTMGRGIPVQRGSTGNPEGVPSESRGTFGETDRRGANWATSEILRRAQPLPGVLASLQSARPVTRLQRLRTWLRAMVGLRPLPHDLVWVSQPLPQPKGDTLTFRRSLPPEFRTRAENEQAATPVTRSQAMGAAIAQSYRELAEPPRFVDVTTTVAELPRPTPEQQAQRVADCSRPYGCRMASPAGARATVCRVCGSTGNCA